MPTSKRTRRQRAEVSPYAARLESARRAFSSDAKVAEALGVDRAQVKRWREGETEPGGGERRSGGRPGCCRGAPVGLPRAHLHPQVAHGLQCPPR
jgi:hypothetical protein